jgi:hypothetical protein
MAVAASSAALHAAWSRAGVNFSGTPVTLKHDAGWCWFQDPRAVITSTGQLVFGSIAGVTNGGYGNAGDAYATTVDLASGTEAGTLLHSKLDQDDHASPAFSTLPDGRILATYESHGGSNYVYWRVGTVGTGVTTWGAEQTSTVNTTNDGNGNTYNNPYYLSTPNKVYDFSRAIGYDPNYSVFSGINATNNSGMTNAANFSYGGHWIYWNNPNNGVNNANGGNGRPYVKYASNGTNTVWFATTEDSPDNYDNSLYAGYIKFNAAGVGTVFTSAGTALGGLATGTGPTTATVNQGSIGSGTGFSFNPTQFTTVLATNAAANGMAGKAVSWATDMHLDANGNPFMGVVVRDNLNDAAGSNLEYYESRFDGTAWHSCRVGYAGSNLQSGQPNYVGLMAVDPTDPNTLYVSANVNPGTDAALAHWQIFEGVSPDGGTTWDWSQLTNSTTVDNIRPVIAAGDGYEELMWMQGTYTGYTNYDTDIVGLTVSTPEPTSLLLATVVAPLAMRRRPRPGRRVN